jgi:hypothetical protein
VTSDNDPNPSSKVAFALIYSHMVHFRAVNVLKGGANAKNGFPEAVELNYHPAEM